MKVVYKIGNLRNEVRHGAVVAVGVFDGVHRGHEKILTSMAQAARALGVKSVVVTFATHPSHFFHPHARVPSLTSLEHKLRLIAATGADICCVLVFNKRLADMRPESFVRTVLKERLGMVSLYVGEDFVFGRRACGDVALLKKLSRDLHFKLHVFKHFKIANRIVKSTLIRSLIRQGRLGLAERLLGRRVSFLGNVVKGEGLGRKLGFPTANILAHHEVLAPDGIYASFAILKGRRYNSLTYIGTRPTFQKKPFRTGPEVYLLGLKKRLYGEKMEVELVKKLRDDRKFLSPDALMLAMKQDLKRAQALFKKLS